MAKPLVLTHKGASLAFDMERLDRSRIYGYIDKEALDDQGRPCQMAYLIADGRTMFGRGSVAQGSLSPDGQWRASGALQPVDAQGQRITPVPSSFNAPIAQMDEATLEDYLSCNVRSVYLLACIEGDLADLKNELLAGKIYRFPFSYRGGLEPDEAFLLAGADGNVWLALGTRTQLEFIGLDDTAAVASDAAEETAPEEDAMDFSMM